MALVLFDVDGTLTDPGEQIHEDMINCLMSFAWGNDIKLGIVGGGTYEKITKQLGISISMFDYVFAECGALVYVDGTLVSKKSMVDYVDRSILNRIISKALSVISDMDITFNGGQIDFRCGLIYVSPVGMQATCQERNMFIKQNKRYHLIDNLITELKSVDVDDLFDIVRGGAVGIAVYLKGWNKSQALDHLDHQHIYFLGDRCDIDGNDYPLYSHPKVHGISVNNYHDTIREIRKLKLSIMI